MQQHQEYWQDCFTAWNLAIFHAVGSNPPDTSIWLGIDRIKNAIEPFLGENLNHAHLPTGGGFDFKSVQKSAEDGCLSFLVEDQMAEIVKPLSLTLEFFPNQPQESFLLLELDKITAKEDYAINNPDSLREDVFEFPPGNYQSRDVWERGYLTHDERGHEVPLPKEGKIVTRWLGGKILFVSKGSIWNSNAGTYDGRHNKMTSSEIRKLIEAVL